MKFFDLGLAFLLAALIAGNAIQYQRDYDRCKASDFQESKCVAHKKNHDRGIKK